MPDYINATAGLLEGNTRASTAKQDRQAQRGMKNQELLQSSANTAVEQQGAMDRTVVQSKQAQLLQNLKDQADMALQTMAQQETSKRQEKELKEKAALERQANYFTMTPNTVKGIKSTIDLDLKDLEGQEVNKDLVLTLIGAKYKSDIAALTAELKKHRDSTGESKDMQKELDTLERDIKANRDKLFGMSIKDLPAEVWQGGKPGDLRALVQNISSGKMGKLDPTTQNQVNMVAGYINTMKSKQERANAIHKKIGSTQTDYTGMGLVGEETGSMTGEAPVYKTADEVRAAYKSGQLSRDNAKKILADNFGLK